MLRLNRQPSRPPPSYCLPCCSSRIATARRHSPLFTMRRSPGSSIWRDLPRRSSSTTMRTIISWRHCCSASRHRCSAFRRSPCGFPFCSPEAGISGPSPALHSPVRRRMAVSGNGGTARVEPDSARFPGGGARLWIGDGVPVWTLLQMVTYLRQSGTDEPGPRRWRLVNQPRDSREPPPPT